MTIPLDLTAMARNWLAEVEIEDWEKDRLHVALIRPLTQSYTAGRAEGLEEALKTTADLECCWDMSDASLWTARHIGDRIADLASSDPAPRDQVEEEGLCSMGQDCEHYGICYAEAQGYPEQCPRLPPPAHPVEPGEVERLRRALEPFAAIARELSPNLKDESVNTMAWAVPRVGDFRRALAAEAEVSRLAEENGRLRAENDRLKTPRMFPVMASKQSAPGPFSIPWSVAVTAYGAYAREYGRSQTLERLAERGGFYWSELDQLHPKWRDEVSEIAALRAALVSLPAEVVETKDGAG